MDAVSRLELEQAVLDLGHTLNWASCRCLPSSSIVAGEAGWQRFVEGHTERGLQRVLEEAGKQTTS